MDEDSIQVILGNDLSVCVAWSGEGADEDPFEMELASELSQEEFHRAGAEGDPLQNGSG